ncbi:HD domain-containing protein, partial [Loigolactobacillus coryniformis]|uniref:HD domain-containing protein n=1 Tax=Loigolactobacillus coryniformis TaxID=1610 RepID=UPI00201B22CA
MIFSNVVLRAFRFADDAHYQQVRKYTGLAYITHPFRVALRAASLGMSEDCVVAAMLHDVVEDCGITLE